MTSLEPLIALLQQQYPNCQVELGEEGINEIVLYIIRVKLKVQFDENNRGSLTVVSFGGHAQSIYPFENFAQLFMRIQQIYEEQADDLYQVRCNLEQADRWSQQIEPAKVVALAIAAEPRSSIRSVGLALDNRAGEHICVTATADHCTVRAYCNQDVTVWNFIVYDKIMSEKTVYEKAYQLDIEDVAGVIQTLAEELD